ncbi:MAG: hypothetical protein QOE96_2052 [Blastocatellia bacterium]|jgi:hypothetical protein|nr:hypothetical protein [Blastocatellia bacterium]
MGGDVQPLLVAVLTPATIRPVISESYSGSAIRQALASHLLLPLLLSADRKPVDSKAESE